MYVFECLLTTFYFTQILTQKHSFTENPVENTTFTEISDPPLLPLYHFFFSQCKLCGSSKVVPKHPVDRRRSPSPTLCSSVSTKPLRFLQLVLDSPALRSRLGCRRESAPLSGSISSLARLQRVVEQKPVVTAPFRQQQKPVVYYSKVTVEQKPSVAAPFRHSAVGQAAGVRVKSLASEFNVPVLTLWSAAP